MDSNFCKLRLKLIQLQSLMFLLLFASAINAGTYKNLVSYYPMNGNANDVFSGLNASVTQATLTTDRFGRANSAYQFCGSGCLISMGNQSQHNSLLDSMSLSMWFYRTGSGTGASGSGGVLGGREGEWLVSVFTDGTINVAISTTNGLDKTTWSWTSTGDTILNDTWYHLVMTFRRGDLKLYLNSDLIYSATTKLRIYHQDGAKNQYNFQLGSRQAFPNQQNFQGKIDDVAIFKQALNTVSIDSLYAENQPGNISLSNDTIQENSPIGTIIGEFPLLDLNNDTLVYEIVSQNINVLSIEKNKLKTSAIVDYELKDTITLTVKAKDPIGNFAEFQYSIKVKNIDEKPYYKGVSKDITIFALLKDSLQFNLADFAELNGAGVSAFSATMANGNTLPAYVTFKQSELKFIFTPQEFDTIDFSIKLSFSDQSGKDSSYTFKVKAYDLKQLLNTDRLFSFPFTNSSVNGIGADSSVIYATQNFAAGFAYDRDSVANSAVNFYNPLSSGERIQYSVTHSSKVFDGFSYSFWMRPAVDLNSSTGRNMFTEFLGLYIIEYDRIDGELSFYINSPTVNDIGYRYKTEFKAKQWYHIVVTVDAISEKAYLYINGNQYLFETTAKQVKPVGVSTLTIGNAQGGGLTFKGVMDDVVVYKRAISYDEVKALFNENVPENLTLTGSSVKENSPIGTFVGKFSATDKDGDPIIYSLSGVQNPDLFHFRISGDSLKTTSVPLNFEYVPEWSFAVRATDKTGFYTEKVFKINVLNVKEGPYYNAVPFNQFMEKGKVYTKFVDRKEFVDPDKDSIVNFTAKLIDGSALPSWIGFKADSLKFTFNTTGVNEGEYFIKLRFEDTTGLDSSVVFGIKVTDLPANVVAYYPFNGNATDVISGINGTTSGVFLGGDRFGKVYSSYALNGTTGHINMGSNTLLEFKDSMTVAAWVYRTGAGSGNFSLDGTTTGGIVFNREGEYQLAIFNNRTIAYAFSTASSPVWSWISTGVVLPSDNSWHHLAMTFRRGTLKIYLNGNVIHTNSNLNPSIVDQAGTSSSQDEFQVGGRQGSPGQQNFKGAIDDVVAFNRALSEAEVKKLFNPLYVVNELPDITMAETDGKKFYTGVKGAFGPSAQITSISVSTLNSGISASVSNDTLYVTPMNGSFGQNSVTLTATNGFNIVSQTIGVTVTGINDTPTDIILSNVSINESLTSSTLVGYITVNDLDLFDTHTVELTTGAGSDDNASFSITTSGSTKTLYLNSFTDFETKSSYKIRLKVTDNGGASFQKAFVVTVNDVNEAPISISISKSSFNENEPVGTVIGTLSTLDPDANETFTYTFGTINNGGGGPKPPINPIPPIGLTKSFQKSSTSSDGLFLLDGNVLKTNFVFDYEVQETPTLSVLIKVTDKGGLSITQTISITILNVAETNDIVLSNNIVEENKSIGSLVGAFSIKNPTEGEKITYALDNPVIFAKAFEAIESEPLSNSSFTISGNQLFTAQVFDYEKDSIYQIRVKATGDLGFSKTMDFTIKIKNVDENLNPGTSVNQLSNSDQLIIRPNPATDYITVEWLNTTSSVRLSIISSNGITKQSNVFSGSRVNVNLSNFERGVYLIRLESEGIVKTQRLLLQ